jgi:hypothetical protein
MSTKYTTINEELFPCVNPKYGEVDNRITGRDFYLVMTMDMPANLSERLAKSGMIDIRDMAEARVFAEHPEDLELTSYGTHYHAYYVHMKDQLRKTYYWIANKQPRSITYFVNKIDGLKATDRTSDSMFSRVQNNMQNGVTSQIVIPETGYSCMVAPVCNKKTMDIFSKVYLCEQIPEDADSELTKAMIAKAERLQDYRQAVQDAIYERINFELKEQGLIDEWKMQNIYTMQTRVGFAVNAQASAILGKYAEDFKIPVASALTIDDLRNPETYNEMIKVIRTYAQAFGINIKLEDSEQDTMTFMPKHWMRKKTPQDIIPDSVVLKQEAKISNKLKKDSIVDILNAYIQIDWYMSQPNPSEFLMEGYAFCGECGHPIRKVTNAYFNEMTGQRYSLDEYVAYKFDGAWGAEAIPVTVCSECNHVYYFADAQAVAEDASYEYLEYKLDSDVE